jgi:hypothetical protein
MFLKSKLNIAGLFIFGGTVKAKMHSVYFLTAELFHSQQ